MRAGPSPSRVSSPATSITSTESRHLKADSIEKTSSEKAPVYELDKLDQLPLIDDDDKDRVIAKEEQPKPVKLWHLFRFSNKTDKLLCLVGTFCSLAAGVVTPAMTIVASGLLFSLINYQTDSPIVVLDHDARKYCLWFMGLGFLMWILSYGLNACWMIAAENQGLRIRELYYESIMRQDIGWFDTIKTGELTTRITNDVNLVQDGIGEKWGFIMMNTTSFITGFIIALVKGWDMALICVVMGWKIAKWTTFEQDNTAESGAIADEVLGGIRTVMAFNGQKSELKRLHTSFGRKKGMVLGVGYGAVQFFIFTMYCIGFNYGIWRIVNGHLNAEQLLIVFFALLMGGFSIAGSAPNFSAVSTAQGCAAKVFAIIDRESPIDPLDSEHGKKVNRVHGHIEFRDVHFSYPTRPGVPILRGFNLEIRPGQKVALVGESGCGKSTTIGLIERFYDPAQGEVLIDGVSIKDYNIGSLRHRIGIVTQEPVLFSTSIYQNIEEVVEACKAANAHQFIDMLPNKYETLVGEGGALLSGGQKQRIAIARAIIRNPDILLLDEATSALDTASERLVQDALDKLSADRTTISIAHRLSTIRNCDQIYVVREGIVSESGTHDELIGFTGEYAAMVKAQELRQAVRANVDSGDTAGEEDVDALIAKELKEQALDLKATTRQTMQSVRRMSTTQSQREAKKQYKSLEESSDFYLLWRLLNQYRGSMKIAIPGSALTIINGAVMPCFALATKYACIFLMFAVVDFVAMSGRAGLLTIAGESMTKRIRHETFKAYLTFESGYFDDEDNGTGMLTARLATEAEDIYKFVAYVIGRVSCWPIQCYAQYLQARAIWESAARTKKAYEKSGQSAAETIRNIKTVATLRREETFIKIFNDHNREPHSTSVRSALACNLFTNALVFFAGCKFIMSNVLMVTMFSSMSIGMLAQLSTMVSKGAVSSRSIYMTLDRKSKINGMNPDGDVSEKFEGNASFKDVKFSYPIRPDTRILKGISFEGMAGKSVALVGASGSGKSYRLYDADTGSVSVENLDVKDWSITGLRDSMAIVGQEPILFNYTIGENIAYGKHGATQQEIEEAAKEANIYNFVMNLPDGFNTNVGQKGSRLSGGQKQRVAIARALVRKPKLLLLDEATAALDSRSEKVVQQVLDKAAKERTTLTVAHRLSTIQDCDMIVVFKNGRIVERGTHDELIALKGTYHLLVEQQSLQVTQ
ncbi:P-loop containing nucleoside triphosphate hydrolase protein [Linderina pennispora]|uniref:p-loop containing nucleoside triphosphate hydrolase protein n=1 Tax=Linderina pennispora TaxID=61395 RepID=A0A1Y1WJA1_9FUNG|nr:P-loop containing nucleoside triphosphate hydrolase protein [Linderina pennispora]ORX73617.1 P-loop containing nucleoside triphosphate hydrolase protein [Linderina pennispora]